MSRIAVTSTLMVVVLVCSITSVATDTNVDVVDAEQGMEWIKLGMVLDVGSPGQPDSVHTGRGTVIFDEGVYKLWYTGNNGINWRIMYATSPDGLSWTKHGIVVDLGPPGSYDDEYAAYPSVLRNETGGYEMWYIGQCSISWGWKIAYATSNDGINWQKHGLVLSKPGKGLAHPSVLKDPSGTYRMWFAEYDTVHWRISHAFSSDGINWSDEGVVLDVGPPGDPDSLFVYNPAVVREPNGTYLMYYCVSDGSPEQEVDIYYATSPDGMGASWTKRGLGIQRGEAGDYDSRQVVPSTLRIRPDGLHELWYVGLESNHGRTMFALQKGEARIDLRTDVVNGKDIQLNWTDPRLPYTDHFVIYRSEDQRAFDFSNWFHNTSGDTNPIATSWVDVDAAGPNSPTEYYYIVRVYYSYGEYSVTSNTAGKWTKDFSSGLNSFSPPLEPFEDTRVSWFADNVPNADFVRWMDTEGRWRTHLAGSGLGVNDTLVEMGRAYEIFLSSEARFTFCGSPASQIRFMEGLGEPQDFRVSLSAHRSGTSVVLTWNLTAGAAEYGIFRSGQRSGLHNFSLQPLGVVPSTQNTWWDIGVLSGSGELYYTVIPIHSNGKLGSSTYGVGVMTVAYSGGSDTFGTPLEPTESSSLDSYCDVIPDTIGMAYLRYSVWKFHARQMPEGVYDDDVVQGQGYQISIAAPVTQCVFIGY